MDQDTTFLQEKLREFGLQNAPMEERDAFFQAASEAILTRVVRKIEKKLPEDKREEFFQLFEKPATDEEKSAFFKAYVPNFKDIFFEEIIRFKTKALKHASGNSEIDSSTKTK